MAVLPETPVIRSTLMIKGKGTLCLRCLRCNHEMKKAPADWTGASLGKPELPICGVVKEWSCSARGNRHVAASSNGVNSSVIERDCRSCNRVTACSGNARRKVIHRVALNPDELAG